MLMEIFEDLKVILRSEKLYDPKNPSIIMCDSDLEIALNMKNLHVTELRDLETVDFAKTAELAREF